MLRALLAPREIATAIKSRMPISRLQVIRQWDRRQKAAAVLLGMVGLSGIWALASGYHYGPVITVRDTSDLPTLSEPVPAEKPAGSSTVPSQQPQLESTPADAGPAVGEAVPAGLSRLVWPVEGEVIRPWGFGFADTYQDYRFHPGIDLGASVESPVTAAADGKVAAITYDPALRWQVLIDHGNSWETAYTGLQQVGNLKVDIPVQAGTPLGLVGEPGTSSDSSIPHLHFEVRHAGEPVNPMDFLP